MMTTSDEIEMNDNFIHKNENSNFLRMIRISFQGIFCPAWGGNSEQSTTAAEPLCSNRTIIAPLQAKHGAAEGSSKLNVSSKKNGINSSQSHVHFFLGNDFPQPLVLDKEQMKEGEEPRNGKEQGQEQIQPSSNGNGSNGKISRMLVKVLGEGSMLLKPQQEKIKFKPYHLMLFPSFLFLMITGYIILASPSKSLNIASSEDEISSPFITTERSSKIFVSTYIYTLFVVLSSMLMHYSDKALVPCSLHEDIVERARNKSSKEANESSDLHVTKETKEMVEKTSDKISTEAKEVPDFYLTEETMKKYIELTWNVIVIIAVVTGMICHTNSLV